MDEHERTFSNHKWKFCGKISREVVMGNNGAKICDKIDPDFWVSNTCNLWQWKILTRYGNITHF